MQQWKERAYAYYWQVINKYEELQKEHSTTIQEWNNRHRLSEDQRKEIEEKSDKEYKTIELFKRNNNSIISIIYGYSKKEYEKRINKSLDREVKDKRDILLTRIYEITGNITEAGLYIGVNGEINGFITGEKGKASVNTIYAGGYNIQCLHYRVLVKEYK